MDASYSTYERRGKLCEAHMKSTLITFQGQPCRYCQQVKMTGEVWEEVLRIEVESSLPPPVLPTGDEVRG